MQEYMVFLEPKLENKIAYKSRPNDKKVAETKPWTEETT